MQMTIKEKFDIRLSRIKDYVDHISYCRDMARLATHLENNITKVVNADEDDVDNVFACIKTYQTISPATNMYEVGDNVHFNMQCCHRFNEKPCPIFNCPYHNDKERYDNQQLLLQQAKIDKQMAFKRIFERIK